MRRFSQIAPWLVLAFFLFAPYPPAAAQEAGEARLNIEAPIAGEAVQGLVQISATIEPPENNGGSLAFRYTGKPDTNWFTIWQSDQPLVSGVLTVWDTTTITDGIYDLILRVRLANGEFSESLIPGIRVRNYTPVETSTPAPTQTAAPGRTITPAPPTPTTMATPRVAASPEANPATLNESQVYRTMLLAGAGVIGVFLMVGIYFGLGVIFRRHR